MLGGALHDALAVFIPTDDAHHQDLFRSFWTLCLGLAGLVVERVFERVETDAERLDAAGQAMAAMVDMLPEPTPRHTRPTPQPRR